MAVKWYSDKSLKLPDSDNMLRPVAAVFDEDEVQDLTSSPNLTELKDVALKYLSLRDKPFILLLECEEMDAASHDNDSERVINGLKSIQQTLSIVLNFSKMQIRWSTNEHTAAVEPLFADGPGAGYFADVHRNWEIGNRLKKLISQGNLSSE